MSANIIYLCEGETEQCLQKVLPLMGKSIKFNMWTQPFRKIARKIKGPVFVIFDSDIIDEAKLKCFIDNVRALRKCGVDVKYLQQTKNLEDELIRTSEINKISELVKHFGAQGKSDLKSHIAQSKNLKERLEQISFEADGLWDQETIPELQHLKLPRADYQQLPKISAEG